MHSVLMDFIRGLLDRWWGRFHMGELVDIHDLHVFSVVLLVLVKCILYKSSFAKIANNILSLRSLFVTLCYNAKIETPHTTQHTYISVLTFGSYEIYKQALLNKFPNTKPAFIYAISAILGDVTGSGCLCPS